MIIGANELVEEKLGDALKDLEGTLDADCLTYFGPIAFGADDDIRDAIEALPDKRPKLVMILQTDGGFAETARRIADTVRHHYSTVDFLVPSHAMSAGTILVMSGDAIHMDYYSVLGPIDPQIPSSDGRGQVPALGYLVRYEDLLKKANKGKITQAEFEILMSFDQGQLYSFEQARELSKTLLKEWLVKYKFKNWNVTETRGVPVTNAMKRRRAGQVADKLNNVRLWNSHGMGINMQQIREVLQLKIDDFGQDATLLKQVREYNSLVVDYMQKMRIDSMVHTHLDFRSLITYPVLA